MRFGRSDDEVGGTVNVLRAGRIAVAASFAGLAVGAVLTGAGVAQAGPAVPAGVPVIQGGGPPAPPPPPPPAPEPNDAAAPAVPGVPEAPAPPAVPQP